MDIQLLPPAPDPKDWKKLGILDRCTCNEYAWTSHACPYAAEFSDDSTDDDCNCCPFCTQDCANDI